MLIDYLKNAYGRNTHKNEFALKLLQCKRLVLKLGLKTKMIYCCVEGCMLFYDKKYKKNDGVLLQCKFCHKPRYRHHNNRASNIKPFSENVMFYLLEKF